MIALTIHDAHSRDRLQRTITERTQRVLEELDVTPPGDPNLPWSIRIEVRGFSRAYEFSVTAARGGTPLESSAEFIPCACSSEDLRDQIEQHLRQRISSLMEAANEAPRDTSPTPPPPAPEKYSSSPNQKERTQNAAGQHSFVQSGFKS